MQPGVVNLITTLDPDPVGKELFLNTGQACINPTSAAAPLGGIKESGMGREGAKEGIHE